MQCPYCQTENREDRETCYFCEKDISTVRLVVNKARQHYNDALEHAERGRVTEAIDELKNAVDLDWSLVNAHVVMGTLYARQGKLTEARQSWQNALALNPELDRAHDYLERVESVQTALPTLRTYRWIAVALLLASATLAAVLIYKTRPAGGILALKQATALLEQNRYGDAMEKLEQASALAEPGGTVETAARALDSTLHLDMEQQIRMIQDLKYRQMYPEALAAISQLESTSPDTATNAALAAIRSDISYYYHNLISQLYTAYEQGDVDFQTLHNEISTFIKLYPGLPEQDDIRGYLDRAERMEAQAAIDELRRGFALDNNVETAVEGLRELDNRLGNMPSFKSERSAFIEEILSYLFNLFTGYLDDEDFARASSLLTDIDRVTTEFRDVVEVDISGAVDLAWSVLSDAQRQYMLQEIESLIDKNQLLAAEEAVWDLMQEPDLSQAEKGVIRSYWRKIHWEQRLGRLFNEITDDSRYFDLKISDREASRTIRLYEDIEDVDMPKRDRIYLTGLAAASAKRLGLEDRATSLAATLQDLDEDSTVTLAVRQMMRPKPDTEEESETTTRPAVRKERDQIRIEPADTIE